MELQGYLLYGFSFDAYFSCKIIECIETGLSMKIETVDLHNLVYDVAKPKT